MLTPDLTLNCSPKPDPTPQLFFQTQGGPTRPLITRAPTNTDSFTDLPSPPHKHSHILNYARTCTPVLGSGLGSGWVWFGVRNAVKGSVRATASLALTFASAPILNLTRPLGTTTTKASTTTKTTAGRLSFDPLLHLPTPLSKTLSTPNSIITLYPTMALTLALIPIFSLTLAITPTKTKTFALVLT